jgi:uncharacterized protein YabN with tetrapyrrole methylase and pyrophosphatase domain
LLEAHQLTSRAAQVGFDWEAVEGIFEKMREEISELQAALVSGLKHEDKPTTIGNAEEEVGDVLFVAVNLARFLGFDPEVALKKANLKFKSRFQLMENEVVRSGRRLDRISKEEFEIMWEAAKKRSNASPEAGAAS